MQLFKKYREKLWISIGLIVMILFLGIYIHRRQIISDQNEVQAILSLEGDVTQTTIVEESSALEIIVDIKGAVQNPGVYQMTSDDRVIDLIEEAGGVLEDADTHSINLAQLLSDQMSVTILTKDQWEVSSQTAIGGIESKVFSSETFMTSNLHQPKLDINQATQADFESLPGIGPSKAAAIISYREENGPFQTVEEIKNVSGIGEKTFEKLQDKIQIGGLP